MSTDSNSVNEQTRKATYEFFGVDVYVVEYGLGIAFIPDPLAHEADDGDEENRARHAAEYATERYPEDL